MNDVRIEIQFIHIPLPTGGEVKTFLSEVEWLMNDIHLLCEGFDTVPAFTTGVRIEGADEEMRAVAQKFESSMRDFVKENQSGISTQEGHRTVFSDDLIIACQDIIEYFSAHLLNALRKDVGKISVRTLRGTWREAKRNEFYELWQVAQHAEVGRIRV